MSARIQAVCSAAGLAAIALVGGGASAPSGDVEVTLDNVRSTAGHVHVELCTAADFTRDCAVTLNVPARPGGTVAVFRGVPAGRYAIQGYHDLNGNGKLDTGLFGVPKEPVFFSRLAKLPFHKPRFADSAFDHGDAAQRIGVRLGSYF